MGMETVWFVMPLLCYPFSGLHAHMLRGSRGFVEDSTEGLFLGLG